MKGRNNLNVLKNSEDDKFEYELINETDKCIASVIQLYMLISNITQYRKEKKIYNEFKKNSEELKEKLSVEIKKFEDWKKELYKKNLVENLDQSAAVFNLNKTLKC